MVCTCNCLSLCLSILHGTPHQFDQKFCFKDRRPRMSYTLSAFALFVAGWTWYGQPQTPEVHEPTSAAPHSEFSCSARCPSSPTVVHSCSGHSWGSALAGFVAGVLVCVLLAWRCKRQQLVHVRVVTPGDAPVTTGTRLSIEGPLTPALRRQLRQQQNAA